MHHPTQPNNISDSAAKRTIRSLGALCISLVIAHLALPAVGQGTGTLVATRPSKTFAPKPQGTPSITQLEQAVMQKINSIRQSRGLSAVAFVPDLLSPARAHSTDMAQRKVLCHTDASGRNPGDRLDACGVPWLRYGENVALVKGFDNPCNTVVDAWMKSPGHAANILDPLLAESAVGVATAGDGTVYLTQVFVTR